MEEVVLDKKHENKLEYLVDDDIPFLNMLRRYLISKTSVLAIDTVTFYENTSAFWDEYIAHRMGLLPVTTPENVPEETEVIFSLNVEGPKKIYSSDLESSDPEIDIPKEIPILTLDEGQSLKLEGKAILGKAKDHAKYQAALASYGQEEDSDRFRFMVETFYQMSPTSALKRVFEQIENDLDDFKQELKTAGEEPEETEEEKETEETEEEKEPEVDVKDVDLPEEEDLSWPGFQSAIGDRDRDFSQEEVSALWKRYKEENKD